MSAHEDVGAGPPLSAELEALEHGLRSEPFPGNKEATLARLSGLGLALQRASNRARMLETQYPRVVFAGELRDELAKHAMASLVVVEAPFRKKGDDAEQNLAEIARVAYRVADAMLRARGAER